MQKMSVQVCSESTAHVEAVHSTSDVPALSAYVI